MTIEERLQVLLEVAVVVLAGGSLHGLDDLVRDAQEALGDHKNNFELGKALADQLLDDYGMERSEDGRSDGWDDGYDEGLEACEEYANEA